MLKAYAIEDLKPGMIVGRDVMDPTGLPLLNAGTVLTNKIIFDLLDRPIFSIYVDDQKEVPDAIAPSHEHLLDDVYVGQYQLVYEEALSLFMRLRDTGKVDLSLVDEIIEPLTSEQMTGGIRAISQIHNMNRSGSYLVHHGIHVAILAGFLGRVLELPKAQRDDLILAGLFIDCGKVRIPDDILEKKGRLTDEEFQEIRRHPEYGYEMLKATPLGANREILLGVLQHHECCDGSGYPFGSRGDEISDFGRILAILDIYDAMAADRSYARRHSPFDIFQILMDDILAGKLDTHYGIPFIRNLCRDLNGSWVKLTTGEKGRIVYIDESRVSSLPIVQTTKNKFYDLNKEKDVHIEQILTAEEAGE